MNYFRFLAILFLSSLLLTTAINPVLSHNQLVSVTQSQQQSNLTESQNLASLTPTQPNSFLATELVGQGRQYYENEQYQEAINKLKQAADIFTNLGQLKSEAITRNNLALAYQQLGDWQAATDAILKSLNILKIDHNSDFIDNWIIPDLTSEKSLILAQIMNNYGRLEYFQDNPDKALSSWQLATKIYQKLDNTQGVVVSQINQVQALQALGLYQEAKKAIGTIEKTLDNLPDNLKFKGLISLGNVFRTTGDLANSEHFLQQALELAESANSLKNITTSYLSLADTWQSWGNLERERELPIRYEYFPWLCDINESLSFSETTTNLYQKAENKYRQLLESQKLISSTTEIKAQLNLLKLLITNGKWSEAQELSSHIQLSNLANSRTKVYAHINFAKSLACLKQQNSLENSSWEKITNLIKTAIQDAKELQDKRAKSYAMGNLGGLYEYFALLAQQQQQSNQAQQWRQQAAQLTQQALYIAQPSEMPDIAYQWQWQLGRLFKAEGNTLESINYYQSAVQTLESVRRDLLSINSDVQFSFRDNIEPVYRQLAQLLLEQPIAKNLTQTRQVIQNLQLAELENFLRCNLETTQALDKIANRPNATEAIIYPILLDGQIDIILKLPNSNELKYHTTKVSTKIVATVLQRLQINLAKPHTRKKVQADANQIYQWLIEPIAEDLEAAKVDTLVFFLDTALRNIPMAVLYDGNKYLIENYAVAITSGLELLEPRRLEREQLNAMLAGLTESRQNYPPLKNVDRQFNQVSAEIPSQILLNEQFTVSSFQNQLEFLPFPVVHIATHGQFSSQPEQTFILAWDNLIDLNQLSSLLKNSEINKSEPIELLVLAACETAQGDKRATLGLAGVAINAGARSTLATLWKVSADESPGILLSQFYRELINNPNLTKAEALRRSQLEFLKDDSLSRPYFWASYVLLGNWL